MKRSRKANISIYEVRKTNGMECKGKTLLQEEVDLIGFGSCSLLDFVYVLLQKKSRLTSRMLVEAGNILMHEKSSNAIRRNSVLL